MLSNKRSLFFLVVLCIFSIGLAFGALAKEVKENTIDEVLKVLNIHTVSDSKIKLYVTTIPGAAPPRIKVQNERRKTFRFLKYQTNKEGKNVALWSWIVKGSIAKNYYKKEAVLLIANKKGTLKFEEQILLKKAKRIAYGKKSGISVKLLIILLVAVGLYFFLSKGKKEEKSLVGEDGPFSKKAFEEEPPIIKDEEIVAPGEAEEISSELPEEPSAPEEEIAVEEEAAPMIEDTEEVMPVEEEVEEQPTIEENIEVPAEEPVMPESTPEESVEPAAENVSEPPAEEEDTTPNF